MTRVAGALMLDVWVVPGSSRTEISGIPDGALRIRVAAPAVDGMANRAMVRHLSRSVRSEVSLVKGATSRRKRVRIENTDLAAVAVSLGIEDL